MKKLYLLFVFMVVAASCDKPIEYNQTLGLLSEYNILKAAGGSTDVAVFSNTSWTVRPLSPASWASIDRLSGEGSGRVIFDFEQNFGRSRRVVLEFRAADKTMTLNMYQEAAIADEDVEMTLGTSEYEASMAGEQKSFSFQTNLIYDLERISLDVVYDDGAGQKDWIRLSEVTATSVTLNVDANKTGVARAANVRLAHSDEGEYNSTAPNILYSNIIKITQP